MPAHILLSSERQDWRTPEWFLDLVREVAPIGLDPCTSERNPTRAEEYFAPAHYAHGWRGPCGLAGPWDRVLRAPDTLAFVNPPYGAHLSGPIEPDYQIMRKGGLVGTGRGWARKIAEYSGERIALVPVRTDTEWWDTLFEASSLVLFWRSAKYGSRISFVNPDTGKPVQGSNLASTVFYNGPNPDRFARAFAPHGKLIRGGR